MTLPEKILAVLIHVKMSLTTKGVSYAVGRTYDTATGIDKIRRALYALEAEGKVESRGSSSQYRWVFVTDEIRAHREAEKAEHKARLAVADRLVRLLHTSVSPRSDQICITLTMAQAEALADLLVKGGLS